MQLGTAALAEPRGLTKGYLDRWEPESGEFWQATGSRVAWRTLAITTTGLVLSFATWFMMSAVVVRLPGVGFKFDTMQLFWLTAMPGLAGGTLRLVHTFLIPIFGTQKVITASTLLKLIPVLGIGIAVTRPDTPFWLFMVLAFTAGFGGGDFSSFMPSTRFFFPKRLQGTALGIQAGIGNFGVSLAQFVTPWIIGVSALSVVTGESTLLKTADGTQEIWLQNAALWYAPLLLLVAVVAWYGLRSVPLKASVREQLDIFKNKHTWFCTVTYVMTFGSFSGLAAAFPLLIKTVYGHFPNAPDPLAYAFLGPLVGSLVRVLCGPLADRFGGAVITQLSGVGLIGGAAVLGFGGLLTPQSLDDFPMFVGVVLAMFFFAGVGNASTFRQYPLIFESNPRQGAGVLGFTAAIAAYGPFIFSTLIGLVTTYLGSPALFFVGLAGYCLIATAINWWFYARRGAECPS
jgi:MFS transporter, NNP family, nitrate/nitrite transporter